ncbi:MAG: hypothetical protein HC859_10260 [Bacteroidia bacterium]|nr:hypothetical protein [Bacteroidia bacterium]
MQATFEISLYPLSEQYEKIVLEFLADLNEYNDITVETNGMSTQVFGELDHVFPILQELSKIYMEKYAAILVMKVGKGHLRY